MILRPLFLAAILATGLSGCADFGLPEPGFATRWYAGSGDAAAPDGNGCTPAGCPQAPQFCLARGYRPDSDGYHRCLASVEENLRKASR